MDLEAGQECYISRFGGLLLYGNAGVARAHVDDGVVSDPAPAFVDDGGVDWEAARVVIDAA